MRERERLEDFRGGHVACRACRTLIFFRPDGHKAKTCCGLLYAPTKRQTDLLIFDQLRPGEIDHFELESTYEEKKASILAERLAASEARKQQKAALLAVPQTSRVHEDDDDEDEEEEEEDEEEGNEDEGDEEDEDTTEALKDPPVLTEAAPAVDRESMDTPEQRARHLAFLNGMPLHGMDADEERALDAGVADLVATPAQIAERTLERTESFKRRGRT